MKKMRYTELQIAFALPEGQSKQMMAEFSRKIRISEPAFHRWKKEYAGLGVAEVRWLKQLEEENRKLRQLLVS